MDAVDPVVGLPVAPGLRFTAAADFADDFWVSLFSPLSSSGEFFPAAVPGL